MPEPARLATTRRGTAVEAVVRGHVAVVDAAGRLVGAAGDPSAVTTMRSCVKPLQALPFARRALDAVGAGGAELAIACASHGGEPVHVEVVRRLLGLCGAGEGELSCGPQLPSDQEAATQLLLSGGAPRPVHNNCSGKHAGMLATCAVAGWSRQGYAATDHPLQLEIAGLLGRLAGVDLSRAPRGIDGCGLPTHGVPLRALARMFAATGPEDGFVRCQDAMAAHPHLVAGRGRFDTALLALCGDTLTVKGGGAAVWVALHRGRGEAVAIKLEAGDAAAMPAVALAGLAALGWLPDPALADSRLDEFREPPVRNWSGDKVGAITVDPGWAASIV